jgi:large subunit ribosomal protein L4
VGHIRNPLWRHGGIVFGPHPRDFDYTLPKKIKKLALRSIINNRALENNMVILSDLALPDCKTKSLLAILKKLKIKQKALLVINTMDDNIRLAARNIPYIQLAEAKGLNTYNVLSSEKLLITKDAFHTVIERIR